MLDEEKIREFEHSLQSILFKYLQVNGQDGVPLVEYIGMPLNGITICTVNSTHFGIPVSSANVLYKYCLDRSISATKIYDGLLTLKIDEGYKLLVSLRLEGY